jgi:hypothetical protein
MHPLYKIRKRLKCTWGDIAEHIRKKNRSDQPSRDQLSQIVCGRQISPKMADYIHHAFPSIGRESLLYYRKGEKSITPQVTKIKRNNLGGRKK